MSTRVKNKQVELRLMLKNKRTCCICHDPHKEVQIHHIDGTHENNTEKNLAVLCLVHHSQATAGLESHKTGLGRKLTREEVYAFKKAWETKVSEEFKIEKKIVPLRKKNNWKFSMNLKLIK
jgi:5-methylcytosine-specific restriction endonuclease McrA